MAERWSDYRRVVRWPAGDVTTKPVSIGGLTRESSNLPWRMVLLRVGYLGALPLTACVATVKGADGGTVFGEIDVPLAMAVEDPVIVELTPLAHSAELAVVVSATPVAGWVPGIASRMIPAIQNQVIPLPQWVRLVTAGGAGAFRLRDRAGGAMSAVVTSAVRPAAAVDAICTSVGPIFLWYTD